MLKVQQCYRIYSRCSSATGSTGAQGSTGPVAGSSNQVVYKDGSNNPAGSTNFTFDGTNLTVSGNLKYWWCINL